MALGNFLQSLFGSKEKTEAFQRYNPQQEQVLNQLLGGGQQLLPQSFDFLNMLLSQSPEAQEAFERPALRQFQEDIIPGIAERFIGRYGPGSTQSSGFQHAVTGQASRLAENLAAQRANRGLQGVQQLQSLLGGGLTQRSDQFIRPARPGALAQLLPIFGQLGGTYLSGGLR